jgi:XTP/dITP diphosphohydrolase
MQLVLATCNIHKIRELKGMLKKIKLPLDILSLLDFPKYAPSQETGASFEENAIMKATEAARALNCWALADDSGLIVPALGGKPGLNTARFAGKQASDKDNRQKLLLEMQSIKDSNRHAYFECALALAHPQGLKKSVRAVCEGSITMEEKGRNGFGYDSLFLKHEYSKTFAELEEEVKNLVSHRRKALDKLLPCIEDLCIT